MDTNITAAIKVTSEDRDSWARVATQAMLDGVPWEAKYAAKQFATATSHLTDLREYATKHRND